MKKLNFALLFTLIVLLTSCAAHLKFVDRDTGKTYIGSTGSTMSSSGDLTAKIEGENYKGDWVYAPNGGSFSLGTVNASAFGSGGSANAYGTATTVTQSTTGHGLITMHGGQGDHVRCVFDFNTSSDTGIGHCKRQDGRLYDLMIQR